MNQSRGSRLTLSALSLPGSRLPEWSHHGGMSRTVRRGASKGKVTPDYETRQGYVGPSQLSTSSSISSVKPWLRMPDFPAGNPLASEFLQALLLSDWGAFNQTGPQFLASYAKVHHWQHQDRVRFSKAFQHLTDAGCHEHVLLPCVCIFLKWQRAKVPFPWRADFKLIENALKKADAGIQKVLKSSGIQKLNSEPLDLSLNTFAGFMFARGKLLAAIGQYQSELEHICRYLPRKDLVQQYGRVLTCMYVRLAIGRPAYPWIQDLLDCFRTNPGTGNLLRDCNGFGERNRDFCKIAQDFLSMEHDSWRQPLDWSRFERTGKF